jgi:cbb3-type cytochrome oxidase maturation protein
VNVIFILIAVSLLVAIGFLISFIWSIRAGQYEDEYTPSVRILFDDEKNIIENQDEDHSKNSKFQIPDSKQTPKTRTQNPKQSMTTNDQEPMTND